MSDLDYYALSRFFGAKMQPIKTPVFGPVGILPTVIETARIRYAPDRQRPNFTIGQDKVIARCFEKVREGLPPDALLFDPGLARKFVAECNKKGLDYTQPALIRRLLCIRKNPKKYAKSGLVLSPSIVNERHSGSLSLHAPAVEFSLVRLRYRYGVSIDEILIEPTLSEEFESSTRAFIPGLSSKIIRQTALALRKIRFMPKRFKKQLNRLRLDRLEEQWSPLRPIARLTLDTIPSSPGILEVRENERDLYISRNANLHGVLELLANRNVMSIMANPFWNPDPDLIQARFIAESSLPTGELEKLELKLLSEQNPIFNWPLAKPKRAA